MGAFDQPLPPIGVLERSSSKELKRLASDVMGWSVDHAATETIRGALIHVVLDRQKRAEAERHAQEEAAADAARRTPEALHDAIVRALLTHGPLDLDDNDDAMIAAAVVEAVYQRGLATDLVIIPPPPA